MLRKLRLFVARLARPFYAAAINHADAEPEARMIIYLAGTAHLPEHFDMLTDMIDVHYVKFLNKQLLDRMCAAFARRQMEMEMEKNNYYPVPGVDIAWESGVS